MIRACALKSYLYQRANTRRRLSFNGFLFEVTKQREEEKRKFIFFVLYTVIIPQEMKWLPRMSEKDIIVLLLEPCNTPLTTDRRDIGEERLYHSEKKMKLLRCARYREEKVFIAQRILELYLAVPTLAGDSKPLI